MNRRRAPATWVVSIAAISLLALASGAARAQSDEADRRFKEAEALLAAGKVAEACDAFEASNRIEASAGTLINIGLCKEKLGKLGSALVAYRAALERVKDPKKKAIATERAAALEPRVSRLTISVAPEARVEGLAISRDGERVAADDYDRPIPVDGGSYEIAASAPGYRRWSTTIQVEAEGDKASVKVPGLAEKSAAPVETAPVPPEHPAGKGGRRTALKVTGYGLVGVWGVSTVYWGYLTVAGPIPRYEDFQTAPVDANGMEVTATSQDCGNAVLRDGSRSPANAAFDAACNANNRRFIAGVVGAVSLGFGIGMVYLASKSEIKPRHWVIGGAIATSSLVVSALLFTSGGYRSASRSPGPGLTFTW